MNQTNQTSQKINQSKFNKLNKIEFSNLLKNGKRLISPPFKITIQPNSLRKSRFCFIISKKVIPKAVKRNLLRRRLKEFFRQNFDSQIKPETKTNFDVIIGLSSAPESDSHQFVTQICQNFLNQNKQFIIHSSNNDNRNKQT